VVQVRWEQAAQDDVQEIHTYIAADSRRAAAAVVRRFRTEARRLARYPESGRTIPEYDDLRYRELIVGSYRLIYRYLPELNLVRILAVIHGSRRLPPIRGGE
jgi:addiction module RelE/StbE family toxin